MVYARSAQSCDCEFTIKLSLDVSGSSHTIARQRMRDDDGAFPDLSARGADCSH